MPREILIHPVTTRRDWRRFFHLPARLHRNHALWVPNLYRDEWAMINPKKNRALSYCQFEAFLCYINKQLSGRIMAIINHRHNKTYGLQTARFAMLECVDDPDAVSALLNAAETWSKDRGMTRIIGPFGMTLFEAEGFMTEGFENSPSVSTYYNFPFINRHMESSGYGSEEDLSVFRINIPDEMPEFYQRIYQRVLRRDTFELLEFRKRKELKHYIHPILSLMNETFVSIYGFSKMDKLEMDDIARQYMSFLDPRFIKAILKDGEIVAFIIAMPNISKGLRRSRGYLFPIGFMPILRDLRKSTQLDLLLGAIRPDCQGMGLDVVMGMKTFESAKEAGFKLVDSHLELDSNKKVQGEMRRMGGEIYKRYRIYSREL